MIDISNRGRQSYKSKILLFSAMLAFCALFTKPANALQARDVLPKTYSQAAMAQFKAGEQQFRIHHYEEAIPYISKAIELDPKFARAYYMRACCEHDLYDYTAALNDSDQAVALDPDGDPTYYFQRAIAEFRLHMPDKCIEDSSIAIQRRPDFPPSYFLRSKCRLEKGDKKGALEDCNMVIRLDPSDTPAQWLKIHIVSPETYYAATFFANIVAPLVLAIGLLTALAGIVLLFIKTKRKVAGVLLGIGAIVSVIALITPPLISASVTTQSQNAAPAQ
jgi:tetratricopeptide (TPR) repeat protein